MKTVEEISMYELMSQEHTVWIKPNSKFGFDLEIDDEDGEEVVVEKGIHPYAMEGMADFCKRFLSMYENSLRKEAA